MKHELIIKNQETNLKKINDDLMNKIKTSGTLDKLKKIIMEISYNSMNEIVQNINNTTNIFLQELFDDEIYIKLSTCKNLKNEKEKMQINIQLKYKNFLYENLNQLSGGENKRISFALTLALSKIVGSPFLLLDEYMSNLNEELREKSIKILKKYFKNTTIIHTCHEIVNGYHDNVINL